MAFTVGLQGLADEGSVMISDTANDQVEKKRKVSYAVLREQQVKNIDTLVQIDRVLMDPAPVHDARPASPRFYHRCTKSAGRRFTRES
jgi:hypothetical protein